MLTTWPRPSTGSKSFLASSEAHKLRKSFSRCTYLHKPQRHVLCPFYNLKCRNIQEHYVKIGHRPCAGLHSVHKENFTPDKEEESSHGRGGVDRLVPDTMYQLVRVVGPPEIEKPVSTMGTNWSIWVGPSKFLSKPVSTMGTNWSIWVGPSKFLPKPVSTMGTKWSIWVGPSKCLATPVSTKCY